MSQHLSLYHCYLFLSRPISCSCRPIQKSLFTQHSSSLSWESCTTLSLLPSFAQKPCPLVWELGKSLCNIRRNVKDQSLITGRNGYKTGFFLCVCLFFICFLGGFFGGEVRFYPYKKRGHRQPNMDSECNIAHNKSHVSQLCKATCHITFKKMVTIT